MDDLFTNNQIDIQDFPSIDTLNLKGLHKDYLTAKIMGAIFFWLIICAVILSVVFFKKDEFPIDLTIIVPSILGAVVLIRFAALYFGFKRKKYALRERDILYKSGLLWRTNIVIPFNRIQHAEVSQGPLERLFNLSVLRVFTAGGSSSDMSIPGFRPADANDIKEFILGKTSFDEEE